MPVALVVLAIIGATIWFTSRQTPIYEATALVSVSVGDSAQVIEGSADGRLAYERSVANEIQYINGDELRAEFAEQLGFSPTVRVESRDGDIFAFSVRSPHPDQLAAATNTIADVYVQQRSDRVVSEYLNSIDAVQRQLAELQSQETELLRSVELLRNALDPFETNELGELVHGDAEIAQYELRVQDREREIAPELALIRARRVGLEQTLDDLTLSSSLRGGAAVVVREATQPNSPVTPNWFVNLVLGSVAALLCGLGTAGVLEFVDRRARTTADLRRVLGDDVTIVSIPRAEKVKKKFRARTEPGSTIAMRTMPASPVAQSIWELDGVLNYLKQDRENDEEGFSVLVTSAEPEAGKTFVVSNLAVAFARAGEETLAVDLDLRRPRLHSMFDIPNQRGVVAYLAAWVETGNADPTGTVERVETSLRVQPAGRMSGNPVGAAALVEHRGIPELWTSADVTLFDTPPLFAAAEGLMWASMCDVVVVVARSGQTQIPEFVEAVNKVSGLDVGVVLVLTDVRETKTAYKYAGAYS